MLHQDAVIDVMKRVMVLTNSNPPSASSVPQVHHSCPPAAQALLCLLWYLLPDAMVAACWVLGQRSNVERTRSQALGMLASNASLGGCFPSGATVMRRHHGGDMQRVLLSQLTVGDVVQVTTTDLIAALPCHSRMPPTALRANRCTQRNDLHVIWS